MNARECITAIAAADECCFLVGKQKKIEEINGTLTILLSLSRKVSNYSVKK